MTWQEFKDKKAWEIDAGHRPYVLLRHVAVDPPIDPSYNWIQRVQIYINKHIPFGQSGPLPSAMEENVILVLDEAFKSMLEELKQADEYYRFLANPQRSH